MLNERECYNSQGFNNLVLRDVLIDFVFVRADHQRVVEVNDIYYCLLPNKKIAESEYE